MKSPLGTSTLIVLAIIGLLFTTIFRAAAQTSNPVLSFESVADLRAYSTTGFGTTVPQALTGGYYIGGDGGGNRFIWSATSTATDNGGTVIKPDGVTLGSPGRWLATITTTFNVKTFGAKGDEITDDTARVNAAFAAALAQPNGGTVLFPSGSFNITGITISTAKRLSIRGSGPSSEILWSGPGHLFTWTVEADELQIADLLICPRDAANATHAAFFFGMGCARSRIDGLLTEPSPPSGFKLGDILNLAGATNFGGVAHVTDSVFVNNCFFYSFTGCAVKIGWGSRVDLINVHCLGQNVGALGVHLVGDNGGVTIVSCDLLGCGVGLWVDSGNYIYGSEVVGFGEGRTPGTPLLTNREIFLGTNVGADTCGIGVKITDGCKFSWNGVWAAACKNRNIFVGTGSPQLVLTGGQVLDAGAVGLASGVSAAHGMEMQSGELVISGVKFENNYNATTHNEGIGLVVGSGVNVSTITGCRFSSNYRGMEHNGPHFSATGNVFHDNQQPNIVTGGGSIQYRNNLIFSGGNAGERDGTAWTPYSPALSAGSGSFASAFATGAYDRIGRTVHYRVKVTITSNGYASGYVQVGLPIPAIDSSSHTGYGVESGVTGKSLAIQSQGSSAVLARFGDTVGYPGANGALLVISGTYEAAP